MNRGKRPSNVRCALFVQVSESTIEVADPKILSALQEKAHYLDKFADFLGKGCTVLWTRDFGRQADHLGPGDHLSTDSDDLEKLQEELGRLRSRACRLANMLSQHRFLLDEFGLWRDDSTGRLNVVERLVNVPCYSFHCDRPRRTADIDNPSKDRALSFAITDVALGTALQGTLKESFVADSLGALQSHAADYVTKELVRRGYLPAGAKLELAADGLDVARSDGERDIHL
eukprot:SAG31_NODE_1997_length_6694_cov_12.857056_4_plen_230_part_00